MSTLDMIRGFDRMRPVFNGIAGIRVLYGKERAMAEVEEKRVQEDLFSLVKKLADLVETSVVVTITGLSLRMEDEWRKVFLEPGGATAGKHLSATLKLCDSPNKPGVSYEIDVDPDFCGVLEKEKTTDCG